ncbi:JAB domain-containing protein [archaeon]|nr:JAB domain-containing protein [archaeon]
MKIKDIIERERPKEKFIELGPESLSDTELLSIILRTGIINENVLELSHKLIKKYGMKNLFSCSVEELCEIKGIGKSKAVQILTIPELVKRINLGSEKISKIKCGKDVYNLMKEKLEGKTKEYFYCLLLDSKNKIIKIENVSVGILDASIVHPREIFKSAIKSSSSSIILVHNHPSGESTPSEEDISITKKLIECGDLLGINVIDHIIIGKNNYWSYLENE